MNIAEMEHINSSSLLCTSCKAKEKAVARCADCPHFLCPNCNTAHQVLTRLSKQCKKEKLYIFKNIHIFYL